MPRSSFSPFRSALAAAVLGAAVLAQIPTNNECFGAITLSDGVNPTPPLGFSGNTYTNANATNSANFGVDCATNGAGHFNKDVFFTYTSSLTGVIRVRTCTPAGFQLGTLADTVLSVYALGACGGGGAPIACNDDSCSNLSSLTFNAVQGVTYLIRVGSWSATAAGTFTIEVAPQMTNDLCTQPASLAVGTQASPGYTLGTTYAQTIDSNLLGCGPWADADVWYGYTAPTDQFLYVFASGSGVKSLSLHMSGCPVAGQVPDACDGVAPLGVSTYISQGATALIRVSSGADFEEGAFTLSSYALTSGAGDICGAPITVFDGVNPAAGTFSMANITEIGETVVPIIDCGPIPALDRSKWFHYVSTIDGPVEVTTCSPQAGAVNALDKARVWVYPADCGAAPISGCPITDCAFAGRSRAVFTAEAGTGYHIRVGVPLNAVNPSGEFDLKIGPANTTCPTAFALLPGLVNSDTDLSATGSLYYAITPAVSCMVQLLLLSGGEDNQLAQASTCASLAAASNQQGPVVFYANAGTTHYVRVQKTGAGSGAFDLFYSCLTTPANDEPANAIALLDGVNPSPPNGDPSTAFHNVGATDTAGMSTCFSLKNDVFFTYQAGSLERVKISLCPVAGLPATSLGDPVMQVLIGGNVVACVDDTCDLKPSVTLLTTFTPQTYTIRIGEWLGGLGGTFRITVEKQLSLVMTSPLGAGSIQIENKFGEPNAFYFTVLTLNAGNYPYGPFFGIEPSGAEIIVQIQSNAAPFLGALNANGASLFGPVVGLPPLDVYGVTLTFNPLGFVDEVSAPAHRSTY